MIIFQDIFTGDELFSDAYDFRVEVDLFYRVEAEMITVRQNTDIDIGTNASAEEVGETLEDGMITVNDIIYSFRLRAVSFDKKTYLTHLKGYLQAVKEKLEESNPSRAKAFEIDAPAAVKEIMAHFQDYEFYVGESKNPHGAVALLNYEADGVTPYFLLWKDGLSEIKV
ncbi:translationally-controlled tumor protein [Nocardia sp. NPDC052112]|uniref:translationally-controlled tumor protein n=1 Tax=Nocardia sp. NPDC052112 TaxID=3155646 RepID=UPI0034471713